MLFSAILEDCPTTHSNNNNNNNSNILSSEAYQVVSTSS